MNDQKITGDLCPTYYHAKAAASLLMYQMAVELAPGVDGYGLEFSQLKGRGDIQTAMKKLDVETFWGPINQTSTFDGHVDGNMLRGWNAGYQIGIGQFQENATAPTLVEFPGKHRRPIYPARWPDWCLVTGLRGWSGVCPWYYLRVTEMLA
eukprot:COSAG04_NODE_10925_length_743_cov_1.178571_2_plen_150_part_01